MTKAMLQLELKPCFGDFVKRRFTIADMKRRRKEKPDLETLGGRLADARDAKGLSQEEVAEKFGIKPQAVSQWERNETRPDMSKLHTLSRLYGVMSEWLAEAGGERYGARNEGPVIRVIDRVQAGKWTDLLEPVHQDESARYIAIDPAAALSPAAFALEISGPSMLPEFRDGDLVVIDPAVEPGPGDFVVAKLEDDAKATFKKYRPRKADKEGHRIIELVPLNPDWPTLEISPASPGRIIGTMVEHRRYRGSRRAPVVNYDEE